MENMEFVRGDATDHTFAMPAANWTPGGRLFFAAKAAIDDDSSDTSAVIQANWGDEAVSTVTINGVAYKKYACHFPPSATNAAVSGGAATAEYLGEFQYVPTTGNPITFPPGEDKIPVLLYFDVIRKTVA